MGLKEFTIHWAFHSDAWLLIVSSERGAEVEAPGSQEGGSLPPRGYSVISRPLICFKSKTLLDECYTAFFNIDLEQMEGEKRCHSSL